eukprot:2740055-Ditylum_brightwellii.AAC.1
MKSTHMWIFLVSWERLPMCLVARAAILLSMWNSAMMDTVLENWSLERCFMPEVSGPFPSFALTSKLMISMCWCLEADKPSTLKLLGMQGQGHMKNMVRDNGRSGIGLNPSTGAAWSNMDLILFSSFCMSVWDPKDELKRLLAHVS